MPSCWVTLYCTGVRRGASSSSLGFFQSLMVSPFQRGAGSEARAADSARQASVPPASIRSAAAAAARIDRSLILPPCSRTLPCPRRMAGRTATARRRLRAASVATPLESALPAAVSDGLQLRCRAVSPAAGTGQNRAARCSHGRSTSLVGLVAYLLAVGSMAYFARVPRRPAGAEERRLRRRRAARCRARRSTSPCCSRSRSCTACSPATAPRPGWLAGSRRRSRAAPIRRSPACRWSPSARSGGRCPSRSGRSRRRAARSPFWPSPAAAG